MNFLGIVGTNELIILMFCISVVPAIFFLLTQQNTLKAIQPQNRTMQPGEVWLQLIPLFNLIWSFVVVTKIADSLQRELATKNTFSFEQQEPAMANLSGPKPTYNIGIAYCILICCSIIPLLGGVAGFAGFVCWIIYWVQLSDYKSRVTAKNYSAHYSSGGNDPGQLS